MRYHFFQSAVALYLLAGLSHAAEPISLETRLEPFVDEFLIESMNGDLSQQLQKPEPKEVSLVTDKPWEGNTCAYYTIFQDSDRYRMYYRGSHFDEKTRKGTHPEVTCYAESKDGIHWTKPNLGLFEFNGSTENNIVWDGIGTHCFAAFKDENPDCPADAKYKGISRGRPQGKRGLYVFQSPDAIHWKLMHPEPVITTGAFDSQNLAFWDRHTKEYREYHRIFTNGIRAIMTGTSKDMIHWSKPQLLKYPDTPDQHLYTNAVLPDPRAPHILIGFPTRFLPAEGQRVEPTFMSSRDGVTFRRWLDPVIPESAPKDRGGNRSNYMAWGVVELPSRPNHLSVYATEAYYTGPDSRLRRFEYRKDGFVSIHAGQKGGELLTKPIKLGKLAERLVLNYKTSNDDGSVRVGIETLSGQPIAGHDIKDCTPLTGDAISKTVTWKKSADISTLKGKSVRLRFHIQNADLYSLQFQPWLR
ncbi:glycoside hydrolase family protein [Thalassoroseus pseudoceratinae]|uniref:hypothetical protein n=1 Tax=Thalassoroseus pseudoceratinae TaxID=2713176 RepID=UPI00142386B9|nr:hypothetical protein [Thalassoroseus pseudoceratinae]